MFTGSVSALGIFFLPFPTGAGSFPPPPSPNNLECLLAVSKHLAHPLHPVYDVAGGVGLGCRGFNGIERGPTDDIRIPHTFVQR